MNSLRRAGVAIVLAGGLGLAGFLVIGRPDRAPSTHASIARPSASSLLQVGDEVLLREHLARLGGGAQLDLQRLLRGHRVVINVFASWCPACVAELQAFAHAARHAPQGVVFIGIDTNDPNSHKALTLVRQAGIRYPVGIDTSELGVASALGVDNLPSTFYLKSNGTLGAMVLGSETTAQVDSHIQSLES